MAKYEVKCDCFGDDAKIGEMKVPKRFRGPQSRRQSFILWHINRYHRAKPDDAQT